MPVRSPPIMARSTSIKYSGKTVSSFGTSDDNTGSGNLAGAVEDGRSAETGERGGERSGGGGAV